VQISPSSSPFAFLAPPTPRTGATSPIAAETWTVPVTGLFLALVSALNAAKTMFINESLMAEEMGDNKLPPYGDRCAALLRTAYAEQAIAAGLTPDDETADALLELQIPEAVIITPFSQLPSKFSFHLRRGIEPVESFRLAS
jgi:hypothetical protein